MAGNIKAHQLFFDTELFLLRQIVDRPKGKIGKLFNAGVFKQTGLPDRRSRFFLRAERHCRFKIIQQLGTVLPQLIEASRFDEHFQVLFIHGV